MTDLSYVGLCGLKAKASVNFSMKEVGIGNLDSCGVDFENMRTLACEMQMRKLKDPTSVKVSMDEILNSDELKKVYTIPITLKNGQEAMAIVDQSGRSMAIEFKDEEGKSANFVLSDRLKNEIMKNPKEIEKMLTSEGLMNHLGLEKEFVPENIDELSEGIVKKNLVPTKQEVEEKGNIKEEEYDPEKVKGKDGPENAKEAEEEEVDLEAIAIAVGTSKNALEKFIEAEGIDKNQIKGVKPVSDIEGLECLLDRKLPEQNSTVLVLKTKGEVNHDRGYVIDTNGNKLLGNETKNVNKVAEEIVPEHSCSETIKNIDEARNTAGQKIDKSAYLESRKEFLKQKRDAKLQEINSKNYSSQSERYEAMAEVTFEYKQDMKDLEIEAGTLEIGINDETKEITNDISNEAYSAQKEEEHLYTQSGIEETKEIGAETLETMAGIAGTAVATGAVIANVAKNTDTKVVKEAKEEKEDETAGWSEHDIERFGLGGRGERNK